MCDTLRKGDVIRLVNESGTFEIAEVWPDNEFLLVGGRIIELLDVEMMVR